MSLAAPREHEVMSRCVSGPILLHQVFTRILSGLLESALNAHANECGYWGL